MNLFFYENTPSPEASQFLKLLQTRESLQGLRPLPTNIPAPVDYSLAASSGDLIILFAATDSELQALLGKHEMFSNFQVVLILKDHSIANIRTSHVLKPRFIGFADSTSHTLEEFIINIQKNTANNPYSLHP